MDQSHSTERPGLAWKPSRPRPAGCSGKTDHSGARACLLNGSHNDAGTTNITAAPSQVSVFNFVNSAGKPVYLVQTGTTNVVFIDGTGHMAVGAFINATQLSTPYFPNQIATISNSFATMTWTDGSVWQKSTQTPALTVTHYTNQNGVPVHLIQNGTSQLAFVDGLGRTTLGTMLSATTAQADLYPGDTATFSGNTVTWLDGFVWTQTNNVPLMITFTDSNGDVSHVKLTSPTTLVGLDRAAERSHCHAARMASSSGRMETCGITSLT